jgi:hypothetical protein
MRGDLKRRVERLEQHLGTVSLPWLHIGLTIEILPLNPGERIVEDWLSADNGLMVTRERLTTDPNDQGKRCPVKLDWARRFFQPPNDPLPWPDRTIGNFVTF